MRRLAMVLAVVGTLGAGATDTCAREVSAASVERHAARVERSLARIERAAARYKAWRGCLRRVPVSEHGDRDGGGIGYQYDERDGTGVAGRAALAVDRRGRADYTFLSFSSRPGCSTRRTEPGGTADAARSMARAMTARSGTAPALHTGRGSLESRIAGFRRRTKAVEAAANRFDEWSSCLTQFPVTELGDPAGAFGFRIGKSEAGVPPSYRPAIAIDRSDWDDPDYRLVGFRRGDRPGHDCETDPGESSD